MEGNGLGLGANDLKTRKERPGYGCGTRNSSAKGKLVAPDLLESGLIFPFFFKRQVVAAFYPDFIGSHTLVQSPPYPLF